MKELLRKTLGTVGLLEPVRAARRKLVPPPTLPSEEEKRRTIREYQAKFGTKIFVETGTFLGDTLAAMLPTSTRLYSIELGDELFARARKRFESEAKIKILHGDSGDRIRDVLMEVREPALFWLDGHYSESFDYHGEFIVTAKGKLETPIMAELDAVLASPFPHVVLIDDARAFNGSHDYPSVDEVKAFIAARRPEYKVTMKRDMIRALPRK